MVQLAGRQEGWLATACACSVTFSFTTVTTSTPSLYTLIAWLRSESHCECLYNTHTMSSVPFLLSSTASSLVHITSDSRFCLSTINPPTPCASIPQPVMDSLLACLPQPHRRWLRQHVGTEAMCVSPYDCVVAYLNSRHTSSQRVVLRCVVSLQLWYFQCATTSYDE